MPVSFEGLTCPNCGVPTQWDGTYGRPVTCPYCGAQVMPAPTDVDDIWLMTDPVARARFEFRGQLPELEHDIRYEVLRGGTWTDMDRECKQVLVWACPMTRDRFELEAPILIGDFQSERVQRLCGEMADAMMGRLTPMED